MKERKRTNKKYSPEFKISVILDMRNNDLSYRGTTKKYNLPCQRVQKWERIYLEEGEAGFDVERRGKATKMDNLNKGRPKKKTLDKKVEEDLISEIQRLRMENACLDQHFHEDITLDNIAKHFGYNKYYFSKLFNSLFGISLNNYINNIRISKFIEKAQKEKNLQSTITNLAYDCGFNSMPPFYRTFQNIYHCSPNEYFKK